MDDKGSNRSRGNIKTIFYIVGNYGVGKSTIIKEPILTKEDLFMEIRENVWVLGKEINGADSLSSLDKESVLMRILDNKEKNIIVAGIYYSTIKDIKFFSKHFKVVIIYLNTSFENNAKRIAERGKHINIDTYNSKLRANKSLITSTKGHRKVYIIDNNKPINEVKEEVYKIIDNEKN